MIIIMTGGLHSGWTRSQRFSIRWWRRARGRGEQTWCERHLLHHHHNHHHPHHHHHYPPPYYHQDHPHHHHQRYHDNDTRTTTSTSTLWKESTETPTKPTTTLCLATRQILTGFFKQIWIENVSPQQIVKSSQLDKNIFFSQQNSSTGGLVHRARLTQWQRRWKDLSSEIYHYGFLLLERFFFWEHLQSTPP